MKYTGILVLSLVAAGSISPQPPTNHPEKLHNGDQPASQFSTAPEAAAWDTLRQGVSDNDAAHRKTALAATGTIGPNSQAVRLVASCLQDKDSEVRQTAAATLGEMGSSEAIPSLQAALDDKPEVSFTAAKALWDLGDQSGREIFQQVLAGERTNAPGKLHSAIKKKLTPGQMALMGAQEASGALLGPASIGITAVHEAVKDTKGDVGAPGRAQAAGVLAKDQDPYALTLLEWALGDQNWAVRLAVAKALGERGNQETITKLGPLLNDDRHAVRYMAAASILKLSARASAESREPLPAAAGQKTSTDAVRR